MTSSDTQGTVTELRALESQRYKAMVDKDMAMLDRLLHDDLVYTHSSAVADSKSSYMEGIRNGKFNYRQADRLIEDIKVYGTTVVISGHVKIELGSEAGSRWLNNRFLNVWVKGDKGWQMAAWQSTPIPAAK